MARSDLLRTLVQAGVQGDRSLFRRAVDAIIAEERAKQHHVVADQLEDTIRRENLGPAGGRLNGSFQSLLYEAVPQRTLASLVLSEAVRTACKEVVEEHMRAELLRAHSVEPRHRLLLIGPPGNGKTCLAEAIAESIGLPLLTVRYEGIVGSFLGETAGRLQKLFEHVSTRPCVLFFDEFDTLGKERGDIHDTGEIKRVVSSLLLQIDRLPAYVVVIAATNHQELLDRAVWRRFQLRIELPPPSRSQIAEWLLRASERWHIRFGVSPKSVAEKLRIESFAELEDFALDVIRRLILAQGEKDERSIVSERINQWQTRARKRRR